jgi:hypothetical protein
MLSLTWYMVAVFSLLGTDPTPAGGKLGPLNRMDGTWEVSSLEIRVGKKALRSSISGVRMVINNGTGTWTDGTSRANVKVDLSAFTTYQLGTGSAPIDLVFTAGPEKGRTWQGLCSRCGHAAIVGVSLKQRPEDFTGTESQPVILPCFSVSPAWAGC